MQNTNFIIQFIGLVAVCFFIACFQSRKRKDLLKLQITGALLFALHFLLLGAMSGFIMNLIGAARGYTFLKIGPKNRNIAYLLFFITLFSAATILSWQGARSLLPLIGMTFGTLVYWQKHPSRSRMLVPLSAIPWFAYSYLTGSYPGMMVEAFVTLSAFIGIYRHDIPKRYRLRLARSFN